ncbi:DUF6912 family protein [Yinghuangia aomiensis]
MRVYVPSTPVRLAAVHREGGIGPAPLSAFAVTPASVPGAAPRTPRSWSTPPPCWPAAPLFGLAAQEPRDPEARARRVVLAADVPDGIVSEVPDLGAGAVLVDGTIPVKRIAAIHMDAEDAEADVRAALPAEPGAEPDEALVEALEEHELLWFARQELADLL